jgi:hypothetical protein
MSSIDVSSAAVRDDGLMRTLRMLGRLFGATCPSVCRRDSVRHCRTDGPRHPRTRVRYLTDTVIQCIGTGFRCLKFLA